MSTCTTSTINAADTRRSSLAAYLSLFATDCTWHDFSTVTLAHTATTGVVAIASGDGGAAMESGDFGKALGVLAKAGIDYYALRARAHDTVNDVDVWVYGTPKR